MFAKAVPSPDKSLLASVHAPDWPVATTNALSLSHCMSAVCVLVTICTGAALSCADSVEVGASIHERIATCIPFMKGQLRVVSVGNGAACRCRWLTTRLVRHLCRFRWQRRQRGCLLLSSVRRRRGCCRKRPLTPPHHPPTQFHTA